MSQGAEKANEIISLARRILFRYAPDTEIILGYCKFTLDESVKTISFAIQSGGAELRFNESYVNTLMAQELAVILYIEAVRLALGHVTTRLYRDTKLSLLASDMICIRMGMRTDIGKNNVIYGILNERVLRMEESIRTIYMDTYHKSYDYRNVSLEILYRLLQKKNSGNNNDDGDNGDTRDRNDDSPIMDYINDDTRADNWSDDSCLMDEIHNAAMENGNKWGNDDINGVIKTFLKSPNKVDFKKLMRLMIYRNTPSYRIETHTKPNRRFGLMYPGTKEEYTSNVLIACDISSSMKPYYINTIVDIMIASGKKVKVDYCWWNTVCTNPKTFDRHAKSMKSLSIKCGGGTDCGCVLNMLAKCRTRYDVILIVTDFEFDSRFLKVPPRHARRIVWIATNPDNEVPSIAKKVVPLADVLA